MDFQIFVLVISEDNLKKSSILKPLKFYFEIFFDAPLTWPSFPLYSRYRLVAAITHPHRRPLIVLYSLSLSLWFYIHHGAEGLYLPSCQTNLVIALDAVSLLFCIIINTTAYHLGRYEPSPPSNKELHAYTHYISLSHTHSPIRLRKSRFFPNRDDFIVLFSSFLLKKIKFQNFLSEMMKEKDEEVDLKSEPSDPPKEAEPEPDENPNQGFMYYLVRVLTYSISRNIEVYVGWNALTPRPYIFLSVNSH